MHMEVACFNLLVSSLQWRLVHSHAIGKMRLEKVVVSPGNLTHCLSQVLLLRIVKVDNRSSVSARDDHDLKGPGSPPRAQAEKRLILEHDAFILPCLDGSVLLQHVLAIVLPSVPRQVIELDAWLLGHAGQGPDLAVWVWIRAAHGSSFVLKDLHVAKLFLRLGDTSIFATWREGGGRCSFG